MRKKVEETCSERRRKSGGGRPQASRADQLEDVQATDNDDSRRGVRVQFTSNIYNELGSPRGKPSIIEDASDTDHEEALNYSTASYCKDPSLHRITESKGLRSLELHSTMTPNGTFSACTTDLDAKAVLRIGPFRLIKRLLLNRSDEACGMTGLSRVACGSLGTL